MVLSNLAVYLIAQATLVIACAIYLTDSASSRCGQADIENTVRIATITAAACLMAIARWVLMLQSDGQIALKGFPFLIFAVKSAFVDVLLALSLFTLAKSSNTQGPAATICDYSDHQQVANFWEGVKLSLVAVVFMHVGTFDVETLSPPPRPLERVGRWNACTLGVPAALVALVFAANAACFGVQIWLLVQIGPPAHYMYERHPDDKRLLRLKNVLCGGHFANSRVGCQIFDCVSGINLDVTLPEHAELTNAYSGLVPRLLVFAAFLTATCLLLCGLSLAR